ncbi:glutamate formimidoyltransferase [Lewinellaceae bacterium SD302]|nr:glutamate formimidoyltransferase [Lewinellaceae bacterium SD302]
MSITGPIVECVANVSEGRRKEELEALAEAIRSVQQVKLLHVDPGYDANRTVFTFAGEGEAVLEAAFQLFARSVELIDMRHHQGNHPRMGAVDVCPFVPLAGADLDYCAELARRLGRRVWEAFAMPVYLYEAAATAPHRRNLAEVRRGEYEGLAIKMQQAEWLVDYGTKSWNPGTGTAIIGARPFLIAWNINLSTSEVSIAKEIAARLRGSGRMVTDSRGNKQRVAGEFPGLKAIGWELEKHGICQVSTNVVDPETTSLFAVFERCRELAVEYGTSVTGSELIGLVPERYLLPPGDFDSRDQAMKTAVSLLGLDDLETFNWQERVLEERLK